MPLTLPGGRSIPDHERTRCDIYSRVMGYYAPLADWNKGKRSEFAERVTFAEPQPHQTAPDRRLCDVCLLFADL